MSRISFLLIFIMMSKVVIMISVTIMVGGSTSIHYLEDILFLEEYYEDRRGL